MIHGRKRAYCVLGLMLAGSMVLPAQEPDGSPRAVTFNKVLDFGSTGYVFPSGPVVQGTGGNLYGTTSQGGPGSSGAVYHVTPSGGSLTSLYTFGAQANCLDGAGPNSVVLSTDGNFYGTTLGGGANSIGPGFNGADGTAFRLSPAVH